MKTELYKQYFQSKIAYKVYLTLYNGLVDIANAPYETWNAPFGKRYRLCCERHTIDKAKQVLRAWKESLDEFNSISKISEFNNNLPLSENEIKNQTIELQNKFDEYKFSAMRDTIFEISKAHSHYVHEGLFDGVYRCYNEETIDLAKNCLQRINEYIA